MAKRFTAVKEILEGLSETKFEITKFSEEIRNYVEENNLDILITSIEVDDEEGSYFSEKEYSIYLDQGVVSKEDPHWNSVWDLIKTELEY